MSRLSSKGKTWTLIRKEVLERDGYICLYCKGPAVSVDHIVSKLNGGGDEMDNLASSCRRCNSTKGSKKLMRIPYFNPTYF